MLKNIKQTTSIVLTALFCSVVLINVGSAQAYTYTSITELDTIPYNVKSGSTIVFSGQLTTTSGHVIPNAVVYIKDDISFGRDTTIKKIITDDNGEFYSTHIAKPRNSGAYDFYAVYDGASNISKSRSQTFSVVVSSDSSGNNQNYNSGGSYGSTSIKLDKIPSSVYAGESITFTGIVTSSGYPLTNALVKIMEDDPLSPDQRLGYQRTDSNGEFSITWHVRAGLVETDFDIYAVFDGDSTYDKARSYNQEMSVLKHGGYLVLDSFPSRAKIGDIVTFSGTLNLDSHNPEGAVVYIKDEDSFNRDDLLATAWVDRYGKFTANWFVSDVDFDSVADIYAVFEGNETIYKITTCGNGCYDTIPLRVSGHVPSAPPQTNILPGDEYMELYHSLSFSHTPHVVIVPSPDSYDDVKKHIIPVQEGIRMWEQSLYNKYGGNWEVSFEIIRPGDTFFKSKPDVIVNLVDHEGHAECFDEYWGISDITKRKPVQTTVCSTSLGQSRSNVDVSATAAHEFIHAVGLGHTFNKAGDMMCSVEDGRATCNNLDSKSKIPSILNLEAVVELYGKDGFQNPNNNVRYESKFSLDNNRHNDNSYYVDNTPPITTSSSCDYTDYKYNIEINNEKLKSGWYVWWTLCTDEQINYQFSSSDNANGFMIFVLPPDTDVDDFINDRDGKYYTCEEYEKRWISKGGSCNIAPGSNLVLYNYEESTIWLNGWIQT